MGDYNPHAPHILGEEWVPIRDEYTELSPLQTSVEYGHSFTTEASRTLYDSRFYVGEMPADVSETFYTTAIYAAGTEAQSGPVRSVIIPVDSVATTGTTQAVGSPPNGATALLTPSVDYYYSMSTQSVSAALGVMWIRYNVVPYLPLLDDKRILAVNVLFGASADLTVTPVVALTTNATNVVNARGNPWGSSFNNISRVAFGGDITRFRLGNVALYNATTLLTDEYLPWTYGDIARFDASAGSPVYVAFSVGTFYGDESGSTANVWYSALEVIYCEERRLYVGGWNNRVSSALVNYGANVARMRSWQLKTLLPSMPAGDYTVTISSMNVGDLTTDPVDSALQLNACRELYSIPPHPGIQIDVPYPPENAIGTEFTAEQAAVLPQISLHTSGGVIDEVHVYGRQGAAQVYSSNTATQVLYDAFGQAADYPWVRFYARRFGDTTAPLRLTGVGGLSGSTVAITPDEFDALDEVVDGWKEVTLRFDTPPSMGNSTSPSWIWEAPGEDAGSRWELLVTSAPALSGTAGNLFNPAAQQLSSATYYQPTGATEDLTWMPNGVATAYVSSPTVDNATDAAVIFAQDQPTVTGFAVEAAVQELVGIGLDCGIDPCGIASGINYNRITWTVPGTIDTDTFGSYELQRSDEVTDWETIMLASDSAVTGFSDYEARTGLESTYRIRVIDLYGFYGAWSSEVSITLPSPGATGGDCLERGHLLLFTSNESQSGAYNLAYATIWEGRVTEDFTFVEPSFTQLQPMYDRDYFVAFRPTERGGVRFQRDLLVQAAAISPETLEDFTELRDMAWADLSYVCVRDEEGNRWFATVLVPSGRVQLNRSLYMAVVDIVEVTGTPSQVDP